MEGKNPWVWDAYKLIYQKKASIRDYPPLQLYDAIKVPGFAAILEEYHRGFPNSSIVYVVRDPRDVIAGTYKRWQIQQREELWQSPWCSEEWLGIKSDDPVVRLALRWRSYLERSQRVPGVIYVRYEDFCANKVQFICELGARLGIVVDKERVRWEADEQASEPSVRCYKPQGPGTWKTGYVNSEDAALIQEVCGDQMKKWGYVEEGAAAPSSGASAFRTPPLGDRYSS